MDGGIELTSREIKEIHHALLYAKHCNHGTVGHNILVLLSRFSEFQGFRLDVYGELETPEHVKIIEESKR